MIVVDKDGNKVEPKKESAVEMSPFNADAEKSQDTGITKPSYMGGYVGGGDIEGGYYVSTADMYKKIADTMQKVGGAIGGAIGGNKPNIGEGVGEGVGGEEVDDVTEVIT